MDPSATRSFVEGSKAARSADPDATRPAPLSDPAAVGARLVELGFISEEQWNQAAGAVGGAGDLVNILIQLQQMPSRLAIPSDPPAPALTEYQVKEILAGNLELLRLPNHIILDLLGAGGMGKVFKAFRLTTPRRLEAIKTVLLDVGGTPLDELATARRLFETEAQTLGRLEDDAFTTVYDFQRLHGVDMLFMQYVDGKDLGKIVRERIDAGRPLGVEEAVGHVLDAALALAHAHEQGIFHRDIKPSNLMVTSRGKIKILDFGVARILPRGPVVHKTMTQAQMVVGTPAAMPPEQWKDASSVSAASDIYSLGCTLFFLLAGRMPFEGGSVTEIMYKHVTEPAPSIAKIRADVPEALDRVLAKMLAKDPKDRYADCQELVRAFDEVFEPPAPVVATGTGGGSRIFGNLLKIAAVGAIAVGVYLGLDRSGILRRGVAPDAVEARLAQFQKENARFWPSVDAVRDFLGGAGRFGSQSDLDRAIEKLEGETTARASLEGKAADWLQGFRAKHPEVWSDAAELERTFRSGAPAGWADASALEDAKAKIERRTREKYQSLAASWLEQFQRREPKVWPDLASLEAFAKASLGLDGVDGGPSFAKLRSGIEEETARRRLDQWVEQYQKSHAKLWSDPKELLGVVGGVAAASLSPDQWRGKADVETERRLRKWREDFLRDFHAKHVAVWPDAEELSREAETIFTKTDRGDDESLAKFEAELDELTTALANPFDGVKPPVTGDAERDKRLALMLKTYKSLLALQSRPKDLAAGLELKALVGDQPARQAAVGQTIRYQVRSAKRGYMLALVFQGESSQTLLRWSRPLEPEGSGRSFSSEATTPGTDRLVIYLASEPLLQEEFGDRTAGEEFTREDIETLRGAFRTPLALSRVLQQLRNGWRPAGRAGSSGVSYDREAIDVEIVRPVTAR